MRSIYSTVKMLDAANTLFDAGNLNDIRKEGKHQNDEIAESRWKKVRLPNRINYGSEIPPGSPTEKPTSGLPVFLRHKAHKLLEHPEARENFAVIVCRFDEMDWLLLKLTGNIRAKFYWEDNRINASWVIP